MKQAVFFLVFTFLGFVVSAQEPESPVSTTQADWFSPGNPDSAKLLIPGSATLGNTKGVFRPGDKAKSKKKKPVVSK